MHPARFTAHLARFRPAQRCLKTATPLLFHRTAMAAAATAHKTLSDAIKEDHQEVRPFLKPPLTCCLTLNILKMYEYYDQYVRASGNKDAQERWANQLTWEIARHAVGEEIIVYPLMEKHLGQKGVELADQDRADHQVGRQLFVKAFRMKFVFHLTVRQGRAAQTRVADTWNDGTREFVEGNHGASSQAQRQ